MRHSKEEIINILKQLDGKKAKQSESETLDFKRWITNPKELYKIITEYAVCFANAKGGTLVLGVEDDVVGMEKAITGCGGYNIAEIKSRVYESTDPKILIDVEEVFLEDLQVNIILVHIPQGIGIHTTTDGTGKIRLGNECKPLTGSLRQKRAIELGLLDLTGEVVKKITSDDLDKIEIERMMRIIESKKPELLKLSEKEILKQIGIIKENHPTIAGLLLVGKEEITQEFIPNHEVVYLYMKNDIQYDKRADFKNGILAILDEISRYIEVENRITTVKLGLFHFEIKDFPEETYREAILNAILHRDYSEVGAVFMKHFKDKIEISNPGGFIAGITPENIIRQDSKPRNKHLAEVLRKIGLIEKAGMGVKRIFYIQIASGKELPSYYADEHNVRVIIKDGTFDEHFAKFVKEQEKSGKELSLDEMLIFSVMRRQREIDTTEASRILQLDISTTRELLQSMIKEGYFERSGIKKGMVYRLSSSVYQKLGESLTYIREKGIDEVRFPEMILKYVREYGEITNRVVRELLGVNKDKASRVLIKLVEEGKLTKLGKGKKDAKYIIKNNE